jgi:hypothetical protein
MHIGSEIGVNISSKRLQHDRLAITGMTVSPLSGAARCSTMEFTRPPSRALSFKRDSLRRRRPHDMDHRHPARRPRDQYPSGSLLPPLALCSQSSRELFPTVLRHSRATDDVFAAIEDAEIPMEKVCECILSLCRHCVCRKNEAFPQTVQGKLFRGCSQLACLLGPYSLDVRRQCDDHRFTLLRQNHRCPACPPCRPRFFLLSEPIFWLLMVAADKLPSTRSRAPSMLYDIDLLQHAAVDVAVGDDLAALIAGEPLHPRFKGRITYSPEHRNVSDIGL